MSRIIDDLKSIFTLLFKDSVEYGEKALAAILIVLAGIVVARVFRHWLIKAASRGRFADSLLQNFLLRLSYGAIVTLSIILALRVWVNIATFLTGLGVTGIILGFGLRDTLSNFASGVLLLIYRPFRAGETIEVEGSLGVVKELTIVNMEMTTVDGVRVIMPNSKVWGAKITNYSLSEQRRLELSLKLKPADLKRAVPILEAALDGDPRILKDPKPTIRAASGADDFATVTIWAWVLPQDYAATMNDLYFALSEAVRSAGIAL